VAAPDAFTVSKGGFFSGWIVKEWIWSERGFSKDVAWSYG